MIALPSAPYYLLVQVSLFNGQEATLVHGLHDLHPLSSRLQTQEHAPCQEKVLVISSNFDWSFSPSIVHIRASVDAGIIGTSLETYSSDTLALAGRYTHKIAISNQRILAIAHDTVTFSYKDYKAQGCKKQMTLSLKEFVRRFALHILPKGFVKMRHYGILSSTWKRKKLAILQQQLTRPQPKAPPGLKLRKCPCCKTGTLVTIEVFGSRGPPAHYMGGAKNHFPQTS